MTQNSIVNFHLLILKKSVKWKLFVKPIKDLSSLIQTTFKVIKISL